MTYLVSYEVEEKAMATCVSDERAALRLAAVFEAQGLAKVAIHDGASGEVFCPWAFRRFRSGGVDGEGPGR